MYRKIVLMTSAAMMFATVGDAAIPKPDMTFVRQQVMLNLEKGGAPNFQKRGRHFKPDFLWWLRASDFKVR